MKEAKRAALALCVMAAALAGCNKAATAQERQGGGKTAEAAPSVEFYEKSFSDLLKAENECNRTPELANTAKCLNVRKAANRIRAKLGMEPKYPEVVEDGR
uniref:hypothetical protein n=1 Tax=Brucella pseudintermedia TaxID=370111 RepID=UPI001589DC32|nr:hypothetical protein [Brucella pseudintermedia]